MANVTIETLRWALRHANKMSTHVKWALTSQGGKVGRTYTLMGHATDGNTRYFYGKGKEIQAILETIAWAASRTPEAKSKYISDFFDVRTLFHANSVFNDVHRWQKDQFPERTPHSVATHLAKEAGELAKEPTNITEAADVLMLFTGLMRENGWSLGDVAVAIEHKLMVNKQRAWGQPDADGVVEHLEEIEHEDR